MMLAQISCRILCNGFVQSVQSRILCNDDNAFQIGVLKDQCRFFDPRTQATTSRMLGFRATAVNSFKTFGMQAHLVAKLSRWSAVGIPARIQQGNSIQNVCFCRSCCKGTCLRETHGVTCTHACSLQPTTSFCRCQRRSLLPGLFSSKMSATLSRGDEASDLSCRYPGATPPPSSRPQAAPTATRV